ncbi:hypothetical protein ABGB19_03320 [Mycobacterium sp. B14F4]|uniref:hypothetical protein n=1 Tax=Mycobacterium sp. B14F4 TaxID=3153565 RepID=UPI00325DF6A3
MEHHLSIFRPYDRDAKHEDQLTRAALIVVKLVPLAHAAFLDLARCQPLSALPRPRFEMQTEKLVPLDPDAEDPELAELVSVFLGPHEDLVETQEPNVASERRARYDGVIQYGSRLLVVIESKLYANASDQQSLDINTKGIAPKKKRRVPVRWQDLLDRWWNLMELDVLGPAEVHVLNDFFDNAEENFGDLLPYTDLERCGDHRGRRLRRLRNVLEKATGFSAEVRDVLGHAGVKFPDDQVVAVDRVSLYVESDNLIVSMWPAELAPQYKRVYSDSKRAEALIALTEDPAWQVHANFYLAYWRASVPRRWYPTRHLPGPDYVRQWVNDFHGHRAGRRPREDVNDPKFRHWLVERKYAIENEMESLDEWADKLPMDHFDIRPSIQVTRSWQWADAVARDTTGQLTKEVSDAINQVLLALGEPQLEDIQPLSSDLKTVET